MPTLQTRQKWQKAVNNIAVDAVVLIVDPSLPRAQWPIGKVCKTVPNHDGCIWTAEVLVNGKVYTRPVARLIQLPEFKNDANDA